MSEAKAAIEVLQQFTSALNTTGGIVSLFIVLAVILGYVVVYIYTRLEAMQKRMEEHCTEEIKMAYTRADKAEEKADYSNAALIAALKSATKGGR